MSKTNSSEPQALLAPQTTVGGPPPPPPPYSGKIPVPPPPGTAPQTRLVPPPPPLPGSAPVIPGLSRGYRTPAKDLTEACRSGDLDRVQALFAEFEDTERDADDNDFGFQQHLGLNLIIAISRGYVDIVAYLLDHGADMSNSPDLATQHKDPSIAISVFNTLFDHGLDLKLYPDILHSIVENATLLKYLLSKGADPNGLDDFEMVPLQFCQSCISIRTLLDHGADISRSNLLHEATSISDDTECITQMEYILRRGADINARAVYLGTYEPGTRQYNNGMRRTGNEGTALHWAVRGFKTRREVDLFPRVKWLLERGADREIKDNDGLRPVDYTPNQAMIDLLGINEGL